MPQSSVDLADIALYLEPYATGGKETRTGRQYYVRVWIGKTRGKGQAWEREPLYLSELSANSAALYAFNGIEQERRLQPLRAWIDVLQVGATRPVDSMEIELGAREEAIDLDATPDPKEQGLDAALREGNIGKIVGHVIYGLSQQNDTNIRAYQGELSDSRKRVMHLETTIQTLTKEAMDYVKQREEFRAELVIMQARTGIMAANAIRDNLPHIARAFETWVTSRPAAAPPPPGAPPPANDPPRKPVEKADPGELLDELMGSALSLCQADPTLITQDRWWNFARAYLGMRQYATMRGYPLDPPPILPA